jgi:hypothetical protein
MEQIPGFLVLIVPTIFLVWMKIKMRGRLAKRYYIPHVYFKKVNSKEVTVSGGILGFLRRSLKKTYLITILGLMVC